jgi:DNA-binding NarL/FixJ family response regulator
MISVIHIEDDLLIASLVERVMDPWEEVRHVGYATTGSGGINLCRDKNASIVLLDIELPDISGLDLIGHLRRLDCPPGILVFTARMTESAKIRAADFMLAYTSGKFPDFERFVTGDSAPRWREDIVAYQRVGHVGGCNTAIAFGCQSRTVD